MHLVMIYFAPLIENLKSTNNFTHLTPSPQGLKPTFGVLLSSSCFYVYAVCDVVFIATMKE